MSDRNIPMLLEDIAAAVSSILKYTENWNIDMYESDLKTRHAVERNFEIIGEAASRVPAFYKELHPQVEWRILKDFRNSSFMITLVLTMKLFGIRFNSVYPIC